MTLTFDVQFILEITKNVLSRPQWKLEILHVAMYDGGCQICCNWSRLL